VVPIHHIYSFDEMVEAHTAMEANKAHGKLIVTNAPKKNIRV
jgi:hypothetical protein